MNRGVIDEQRSQIAVLLRFTPALLGFAFSIYYSKLMGIENRSFLTFVLLTNALLSFILLSGLGISIRTSGSVQEVRDLVPAYLIISFLISLLVTGVIIGSLLITYEYLYFFNNGPIPQNALIAIALYSLTSALSVALFDLLSTFESFKAFLLIESMVVLAQIFIFAVLVTFKQTSFFVSALLAYSLSYAFLLFSVLVLIISNGYFGTRIRQSFGLFLGRNLFQSSLRGLVINLIERIDKVLLPAFYSSPQLAQVSIFSGIISFLRIVPDTEVRLTNKHNIHNRETFRPVQSSATFNTLMIICGVALLANLIVYVLLGKDWLLPLPIIVLLTLYEVLVWKAKVTLSDSESRIGKSSNALNFCLAIFFLMPLPLLMLHFSYSWVLACTIVVLSVWLMITKRLAKLSF